jgi:hypothetical protein
MPIKKPKDNSFKVIFDNHDLFVQFLHRFVRLDILEDVRPEDIVDLNERHLPLFQENRDSDIIKQVNLKGKHFPLFVIVVLEHESKVNFRAAFKMLLYITLVLEHYEKEADRKHPGVIYTKKFRYPPILPIIFYDGPERWTAARTLAERTEPGGILSRFIPCFEYLLVSLRDYPFASLVQEADPLSFVMVMDKVRDSAGGSLLEELPEKYVEQLQIPENMRKLIADVTRVLLDARGITRGQVETIIGQFDKGEYRGMFEGIREAFEKSYRRGYRQARTRYENRRHRERKRFEEQIRQDQEQLEQRDERIRLLEEEVRRLRGE